MYNELISQRRHAFMVIDKLCNVTCHLWKWFIMKPCTNLFPNNKQKNLLQNCFVQCFSNLLNDVYLVGIILSIKHPLTVIMSTIIRNVSLHILLHIYVESSLWRHLKKIHVPLEHFCVLEKVRASPCEIHWIS